MPAQAGPPSAFPRSPRALVGGPFQSPSSAPGPLPEGQWKQTPARMPRNQGFSDPEYSAEYSAEYSVSLPSDPERGVGRTHENQGKKI